MTMNRRTLLVSAAALAAGVSFSALRAGAKEKFEIELSEAEWRKRLTPREFAVLREEATEPAFTSPLNDEKRDGVFTCAGCDLPLYDSKTKFDSGTGWPSFYEALPDAVRTKTDFVLFYPRTEVHCRRCGGHLGHIFDDGPDPTGKRHCINGIALNFKPRPDKPAG